MNKKVIIKILILILLIKTISAYDSDLMTSGTSIVSDTPEIISWPLEIAYPGIEYNIRLGVIGGKYPYKFYLTNSPSGMEIDINTGEISWVPNINLEGENFNINILVQDNLGQEVSQSYTLSVTKNNFYFVSPLGSDTSGDGSFNSPWKTIDYSISQGNNDDVLYIMDGTYNEVPTPESGDINKWIGYPDGDNDRPVIDMGGAEKIKIKDRYALIDNLEIVDSSRWFIYNDAGSDNIIIRRNKFHDMNGNVGSGKNVAFIILWGGAVNEQCIIQDNEMYDMTNVDSNCAGYIGFDVLELLIEDNEMYELQNGCGGIMDKDEGYGNTYRGNTLYDISAEAIKIIGQEGGSELDISTGAQYIEVSHNLIYDAKYPFGMLHMISKGQNNINIHHNTLLGGPYYQRTNYINGPVLFHDNILSNEPETRGPAPYFLYPDQFETFFEHMEIDNNLLYNLDYAADAGWDSPSSYSISTWQNTYGFDVNSLWEIDPMFNNVEDGDYRPKEDSPVCGAALDGTDIGALPCLGDGSSDSGFVCTNGATKSCSTNKDGICSTGTQTCSNNAWGNCIQDNQATTEICNNNLDDDCDGNIDEGCNSWNEEIGFSNECDNWEVNHPEWIFCDDFSSNPVVGENSYFEYDDDDGDFVSISGVGIDGSKAMRALYQNGEVSAGSLFLGFGRLPSTYMDKGIESNKDFDEIYYRFFLRMDSNWNGNPAKLTRATVFDKSDWGQAMIAHIWGMDDNYLGIEPVGCVEDGEVICSGYNNALGGGFNLMQWLGPKSGQLEIYNGDYNDEWLCIEHHVKLNSYGESDGVEEYWINDNLDAGSYNLDFVGTYSNYGINAIKLENYWNDGSTQTQSRYFDNFVVSTDRIGCGDLLSSTCTNGQTKSCSTNKDGICSTGTQTCSNNAWSSCIQDNQAITEICNNNLDDNCNGEVDEGCSVEVVGTYQAEDGTLISPMAVDDNYIATDTVEDGSATYLINVNYAGNYSLVGHVYAPDMSSDSFYVSINNGENFIWDLNPEINNYNVWRKDDMTMRGSGSTTEPQFDPYIFYLNKGDNTIKFSGRESGARLDYFYLIERDVIDNVVIEYHDADKDKSGTIEFNEVISFLELWNSGDKSIYNVIEVIKLWSQ